MFIEQQAFNEIKRSLPINAVELLILDSDENILMFKRANEPAKDQWWFPGGRILFAETRMDAAKRVLKDECGITKFDIRKIGMFEYIVENNTDNYHQHIITTVYVVKSFEKNIKIDAQTSTYLWQTSSAWMKNVKHDFLTCLLANFKKETLQYNATSFYMEEIINVNDKFIKPELYNIILKALSVPCVDLVVTNSVREILLVKRKNAPAKDEWWVPGGRVLFGEKRIDTAKRKLKEECGIEANSFKEILDFEFVFNTPGSQVFHNVTTLYEVSVDNEKVVLDNQSSEYSWRSAGAWLNEELDDFIRNLIENKIRNGQDGKALN